MSSYPRSRGGEDPHKPLPAARHRHADAGSEKHARAERLFVRLWDHHHELVRRYLLRRCAPEATEDLVQEVFLRVWLSRHRPLEEAQVPAFLITVARNLWIDHLRWQRNWGNVVSLDDVVLKAEHPERQLTASLRFDSVRQAVRNLSPRRRAVFELRWQAGCSHREIASRLRISVKTVENHLNAAYRELRELLQEPAENGAGARTERAGAPGRPERPGAPARAAGREDAAAGREEGA